VIPQLSARLWVTLATGVVVAVTAPILLLLTALAFSTDSALEAGRLVALATLMVSAVPLVLRAVHHAGGGAPEGGAQWVWEVAFVVVAAVVLLLVLSSSPRVMVEGCGLNGECAKGSNFSPAQPDGPRDDSSPPPSTPPLTR
jgi:hypothetical protein